MVWNNPNELFGQSNKSPELAAGLDFSFHDSFFFFLSLSLWLCLWKQTAIFGSGHISSLISI